MHPSSNLSNACAALNSAVGRKSTYVFGGISVVRKSESDVLQTNRPPRIVLITKITPQSHDIPTPK